MSYEPFLTLDEPIIPNSQLDVKNFFRARLFFFCQGEWIRLITNLILDGLIIAKTEPLVKNFFSAASCKIIFEFNQRDIDNKSSI